MGQNTVTVTDSDFSSAIASDTPTLVDFWAEWCGPCKMMDTPLDELAGENAGKQPEGQSSRAEVTFHEICSFPGGQLYPDT